MQGPHQKNFCDCGLYVTAIVDAFMQDPTGSSESIRVRRRRACPVYSPCLTCIALQKSKKDWWGSREPTDLRETFRKRTVELSEEWRAKRGCAAKEVAAAASKGEAGSAEGPEAEAGKGKGKEERSMERGGGEQRERERGGRGERGRGERKEKRG